MFTGINKYFDYAHPSPHSLSFSLIHLTLFTHLIYIYLREKMSNGEKYLKEIRQITNYYYYVIVLIYL